MLGSAKSCWLLSFGFKIKDYHRELNSSHVTTLKMSESLWQSELSSMRLHWCRCCEVAIRRRQLFSSLNKLCSITSTIQGLCFCPNHLGGPLLNSLQSILIFAVFGDPKLDMYPLCSLTAKQRTLKNFSVYTSESQNGWGWKKTLEVIWSNFPPLAVLPRASCQGPHPDSLWVSPGMETLQLIWATCFSAWSTSW